MGAVFTTTKVGSDVDKQFPLDTDTVYEPLWFTVIVWAVKPFDQVLFSKLEEDNATEPPVQNVVGPFAFMVGVGGVGLTVINVGIEPVEQFPLVTVTEYEPPWFTVIDWAVEPFDQILFDILEDVSITDPPEQNVVGPLWLIVGVDGAGFTITKVGRDVEEQLPFETVTE